MIYHVLRELIYKKNYLLKFRKNIFYHTNINLENTILNEINDKNFNNIINTDKAFLVIAYANYSYKSLEILEKIININNEIKKDLNLNKNISLYKLNININYFLIKNFHIKCVPNVQLRYKNKLIEEILSDNINDTNLKNIINRLYNFYKPIEYVENIKDILIRENELIFNNENIYKKNNILENIKKPLFENVNNILNNHINNNVDNEKKDINELSSKINVLNNLNKNCNYDIYISFKELELLLNEEKKNREKIMKILNKIIFDYYTYLDINMNYSKITTKAFLYLFDDESLSLEKVIEIKNNFLINYKQILKSNEEHLISFNEPFIMFDHFKNMKLQNIENVNNMLSDNDFKNTFQITKKNKLNENNINNMYYVYLSRIYRILTIKYLNINIDQSLSYCLKSYKITFNLNEISHNKSKVLIQNIFLYLPIYNSKILNFKTQLTFLFNKNIFKFIKFPHTKAIKGGKPIMMRGKSKKWLWLSIDWKPRWVKKKTKLRLEEEWKVVPDKNVPFYN